MMLALTLALAAVFSDVSFARQAQRLADPEPAKASSTTSGTPRSAGPTLGPPEPAQAVAMCKLVDSWVRARDIPNASAGEACVAVAVTLRHGGDIVGRGSAIGWPDLNNPNTLALATQQALDEWARRVPAPNDTLGDEVRREQGRSAVISLELAGTPIPLDIKTYADAAILLEPGLDGVLVTVATKDNKASKSAAIFPEFMLVTGQAPADALRSAVSSLTGDPTLAIPGNAKGEPSALIKDRGLAFYRFRVAHLVQTRPNDPPALLFRGSKLISDAEINTDSLRAFADRLARRLIADTTDEAKGIPKSYMPARDEAEESASSLDQLLIATALSRHARLGTPMASASQAAAEAVYISALREESIVGSGIEPATAGNVAREPEAPTAAAMVLAAHELRRPIPTVAAIAVRRSFAPDIGWREAIPEPSRGLIALAFVILAMDEQTASDPLADRVRAEAAVRSIFRDTPAALQVTHLPWLGWAEQMLAPVGRPIASAAALRELRELVWQHQLTAADTTLTPDLQGGILFTKASTPLPTAQTARPLAFLGGAIADLQLTDPPERIPELSRTIAGLRFIRQLSMDEASAYIAKRPERAMWGVRNSMWDQRQTAEAQLMSLLAVDETLRSVEAMRSK